MHLDLNWLTQPRIDYELKSYQLLGYFQRLQRLFRQNKLYPSFHHLKRHYDHLTAYQAFKSAFADQFPKKLEGIDGIPPSLKYHSLPTDEGLLEEINAVVDFALPHFEHSIAEANELQRSLLAQTHFEAVGLLPLYQNEGYLLLAMQQETLVYSYQYSLLHTNRKEEQYRSISTAYVTSYAQSEHVNYRFEYIKRDLVKQHEDMPNPATYALQTDLVLPIKETLLPLAKQALWQT